MTRTEQQRLLVIGKVDRGELTTAQAPAVLQRSARQVRRILAAYRKEGPPPENPAFGERY